MRCASFLRHSEVRHGIELAHGGDSRAERYSDHEDIRPSKDVVERRQADEALILAEGRGVPNCDERRADGAVREDDTFALATGTRAPELGNG